MALAGGDGITFLADRGREPASWHSKGHAVATINGTSGDDDLRGTAQADTINGLDGNDSIDGGLGVDSLFGGNGNDTLYTLHNIDRIDGGPGLDTAVFFRTRGEHTLVKTASGLTVFDLDSSAPYTSVERFLFTDKSLAFDLAPGEAAANTVLVIGAAFGAPAIQQHPDWVGIGLQFFDGGQTLSQVCALVAQIMGLGNSDFVTTVYRNVMGFEPDAAAMAAFVGLLQAGMTQGRLLELAATADPNAVNINLVGLQETGVEFT